MAWHPWPTYLTAHTRTQAHTRTDRYGGHIYGPHTMQVGGEEGEGGVAGSYGMLRIVSLEPYVFLCLSGMEFVLRHSPAPTPVPLPSARHIAPLSSLGHRRR